MFKVSRALLLSLSILLASQALNGQVFKRFAFWKQTVGAEVITIQQPLNSSVDVFLEVINLYCSVAGIVELEKDGADATVVSVAANVIGNPTSVTTVTVFHTSDVGAGAKVDQFRLKADAPRSFNMGDMLMKGNGPAKNYTLRSDCTGTGDYYIRWREE